MAKTQPGGLYKSPDGRYHDAWNRPVEEGVEVFNPPAELGMQPPEAGVRPVGGQIDTPFPGSDQYRQHEQRARDQLAAIEKEQERLAKERERILKQVPMVLDLAALQQIAQALQTGATPRSIGDNPGPTREEHREAGERWEEREQEKLDKLAESSLAVDTNVDDPKKLDKSGQTEGEADMKDASTKKGKKGE